MTHVPHIHVTGHEDEDKNEKFPSETSRIRSASHASTVSSVQDGTPSYDRLKRLDEHLQVKPNLAPSWTDSVCGWTYYYY